MRIRKIILYEEGNFSQIQLKQIKEFIKELFPIQIEIKKNVFLNEDNEIIKKIEKIRIYDLKKPFKKQKDVKEEILSRKENQDIKNIFLYDGFEFCKKILEDISEENSSLEVFHIILTDYLVGTFDNDSFRYHARALIGFNPAIISLTGIIEAPAKSREYYLDLMKNSVFGINEDLGEKYKGGFLKKDDPRISKIVEGYILQAILYFETGEAFCDDTNCRLFNAHWQKDLIFSQIENGKLCKKHLDVINELKSN